MIEIHCGYSAVRITLANRLHVVCNITADMLYVLYKSVHLINVHAQTSMLMFRDKTIYQLRYKTFTVK